MPKKAKTDESGLVAAARAIGSVTGKLAAKVGVGGETAPKARKGKLVKKNKQRLPRRQKKAQQRAAARAGETA